MSPVLGPAQPDLRVVHQAADVGGPGWAIDVSDGWLRGPGRWLRRLRKVPIRPRQAPERPRQAAAGVTTLVSLLPGGWRWSWG